MSNNQGHISWDDVAASGVQFVLAKVSEGTFFRDGWFGDYWSACKRLQLARGAYHFARPSESSAVAEADYFVDAIGLLYGELEPYDVLALDLEDPYAGGDLSAWCLGWLQRVEQRVGFKPLVYTSPGYAQAHALARAPSIGQYGLWCASWGVPTPPPAPLPWNLVAIHQIGVGPAGSVPGVTGQCDLNRFNGSSIEQFKLYGKPAGSVVVPPEPTPEPPPSDLPVYDWAEPPRLQETDADCACESIEWCLYAWGRTPDDDWIEQSMQAAGVWNPEVGCTDASGAGLAGWVNEQYGADGYVASNTSEASWAAVAQEAATLKHPVALGGRAFYHWVGVRGFDAESDCLLLANPAPGWQSVEQTLSRADWDRLGAWSLVRVTHPAAEADRPPPDPEPEPTPPPVDGGENGSGIGSGILELMTADGTSPAQSSSTWLPLGKAPSDIEECVAVNGWVYRWILSTNRGFRYPPS